MTNPKEPSSSEYLCDLAERLMRVPVMYGTDQGDVDHLHRIARDLVQAQEALRAMLEDYNSGPCSNVDCEICKRSRAAEALARKALAE